jgi:hypothetical protein
VRDDGFRNRRYTVANTFAPFGFSQNRGTGSAPTYEQVVAPVAYNTANIFFGDPVFRLSDGSVAGVTTGPGPGTGVLAGIFVGCKYLSVSQKRTVWSNWWIGSDVASGNTVEAYLVNDPNAQFLVQSSGGSGITQAMVGQLIQFAYGTGNTASGISGAYIDATSVGSTSTLPFRVVALTTPVGANTAVTGQYNNAIVAFNNVETKVTTAAA